MDDWSTAEIVRVTIGTLLVFVVAGFRFSAQPPPAPAGPSGVPSWLGTVRSWLVLRDTSGIPPLLEHYPPTRANTTCFKFWLFTSLYMAFAVALYEMILFIPVMRTELQRIMEIAAAFFGSGAAEGQEADSMPGMIVSNAGPVVLAFIISAVLPILPPFKGADRSIRRKLYECAAISAQQRREKNRLKEVIYHVSPEILDEVHKKFTNQDFDEKDVYYSAENCTVHSMWTKAAVVREHINTWATMNRYKAAYDLLNERENPQIKSVDRVNQLFEALKPDARECFEALRLRPGETETKEREQTFRQECRDLLEHMYGFLARVSLRSHLSDADRVVSMRKIGFALTRSNSGPIPTGNEMLWLAILLGCVASVPLSMFMGLGKGIAITVLIYSIVLIPVYLARMFPSLKRRGTGRAPNIKLPIFSAILAVLFGIFTAICLNLENGDVATAWNRYTERAYVFASLHATWAILIAVFMTIGRYPDVDQLKGFNRYRQWGNPQDAAIFAAITLIIVISIVEPRLSEFPRIAADGSARPTWPIFFIPPTIAFVIGFIVPTWYRASSLKLAVPSPPSPRRSPAPSGKISISTG